jgi:hypothetical protein
MDDISDEPQKSGADVAYGLVKAAVSSLPVADGAAAEILSLVFGPPLERRREEWLQRLADAVREIQENVADLTPEKLSQNEAFVSTALRASEIAVRTHQEEKLEALRNAVVSAALPDAPDDTLQQIFLNYVDALTPWHLRLLTFFEDPTAWGAKHGIAYPNWSAGTPASALEIALPELSGNREFYDQLVTDLQQRGLLRQFSMHASMTASGIFSPRISPTGKRFLNFISAK